MTLHSSTFFAALLASLVAATAHADTLALQVLDEINFARTKPQEYARIVAGRAGSFRGSEGARAAREAIKFLEQTRPLPPLSWSRGISQAALSHALEMGSRGARGHQSLNGDLPWKRLARFGHWEGCAGENIDYGHSSPRSIVVSLIVDQGVPSRLHRKNLFGRDYRVTGIAIAPHSSAKTVCVMDFATRYFEAGEERVAARDPGGFRSESRGMSFF